MLCSRNPAAVSRYLVWYACLNLNPAITPRCANALPFPPKDSAIRHRVGLLAWLPSTNPRLPRACAPVASRGFVSLTVAGAAAVFHRFPS